MRRREFITLLGGAAAVWPLAAQAQVSTKRPMVAWLGATVKSASLGFIDAFLRGMRELGHVEGGNYDIVFRFSDGNQDRLPLLAEELVQLKPDVFLAPGSVSAVPLKKATQTIPIVTAALADAIRLGLIASDARPGGNVTGITPYVTGLPAKQIELAREIVAGAIRIGILVDANDPKGPPQLKELEAAGRALELNVIASEVRSPADLEGAFQTLAETRPNVLIVLQTSMFLSVRRQIAELAAAKRLPAIYGYREHVLDGGLVSYGVDLRWCFHRAALYVHKILNGASPGELPVEFPTRLDLTINLKAAKALGLEIPPTLLARADEVIE